MNFDFRKKKVLFHSDFSLLNTGFARNAKSLLTYLYSTGKYEIVHYCVMVNEGAEDLQRTPWKSIGCMPTCPEKIKAIKQDPTVERIASYGAFNIDEVIEKERPDIYIGCQDIWGVDYSVKKPWFNKINSVIWTTLDSLPILPSAVEAAKETPHFWVWSNFAQKSMNKMGLTHVSTVHGVFDDKHFHPLDKKKKLELRKKNNISEDDFVIGFVFRNQLRKSVPNLLQGYKIFKDQHPKSKSKLLLHTNFHEGWDIRKLAAENGVAQEDIITTHICSNCRNYSISPWVGPAQDCENCGAKKTVNTTGVELGVTEKQLNEVYNLMDVYCHPFTSGGQEIPIQEAKLTELITLVTNYSCGEEMCEPDASSLPLDWMEYREINTGFIKANTCPKSIASQISAVYNMPPEQKREMEVKARKWTLENYSVEVIGRKISAFIDNCPLIQKQDYPKFEQKDPNAKVPECKDNSEWVKSLYRLILKTEVTDDDDGLKYWLAEIKNGAGRPAIENYFRQVAAKDNIKNNKVTPSKDLDKDDKGKRILYCVPEGALEVYLSTSIFESLKNTYPDHNIYVATKSEYFDILGGNPFVHKCIEYNEKMADVHSMEKDFFELAFYPAKDQFSHMHKSKDKLSLQVKN